MKLEAATEHNNFFKYFKPYMPRIASSLNDYFTTLKSRVLKNPVYIKTLHSLDRPASTMISMHQLPQHPPAALSL